MDKYLSIPLRFPLWASRAVLAVGLVIWAIIPMAADTHVATGHPTVLNGVEAGAEGTGGDGAARIDYTVIAYFHRRHGPSSPVAGLIQAHDGFFYGVTLNTTNGSDLGAIYRTDGAGKVTTIHAFKGGRDPGPGAGELVEASDGNLYGLSGVSGGTGSLYRVTPAGAYTVLHRFQSDLSFQGSPVQAADGLLYFAANQVGQSGGAIFSATLDGEVRAVHLFKGGKVGFQPQTTLTVGEDGTLYGTTVSGGVFDGGVVYRYSPGQDGLEVIASFNPTICLNPSGRLTFWQNDIYGICKNGGAYGAGSVYRVTPDGVFKTLHDFANDENGEFPTSGVTVDPSTGTLFGTTPQGGFAIGGVIYKILPDGTSYRTLLEFRQRDGCVPQSDLFLAQDGHMYGTATYCGRSFGGTAFRFLP